MSTAIAEVETRPYRDYSADFKAEALTRYKANDNNCLRTARELGIDEALLRFWISKSANYRNLYEQKSADLIQKLDIRAHELVDAMSEKIADATLAQTATALGIVIDKKQLLTGQPTSISVNVDRMELSVMLASVLDEN